MVRARRPRAAPRGTAAIAQEHERRVDARRARDIVFSDAGPLLVAIYGGCCSTTIRSTLRLERQAPTTATLVTGLDLPWVADGLQRDAAHAREDVDALVRGALRKAGIGFQVVYGKARSGCKARLPHWVRAPRSGPRKQLAVVLREVQRPGVRAPPVPPARL
jgi:hypothetical protein